MNYFAGLHLCIAQNSDIADVGLVNEEVKMRCRQHLGVKMRCSIYRFDCLGVVGQKMVFRLENTSGGKLHNWCLMHIVTSTFSPKTLA